MSRGSSRPASPHVAVQLRLIRALRHRASRDGAGSFFVEGARFLLRAVGHGAAIETLVVSWKLLQVTPARQAVRRLRREGTRCLSVSPEEFRGISTTAHASGVGVVVRQQWTPLADVDPYDGTAWLLLRDVRSPGNLGTLLRSLAAVGGGGMILLGGGPDPHDPVTVRATMGALFGLRLVRCTPLEFAAWKARRAVQVVGASPCAELDYDRFRFDPGAILFLGGERKGLSDDDTALCDRMVRIPMAGAVDSLNLGVAGSLLLYESLRQRRT